MQPLEKSMEMGWAVRCASWGGEAPWKCCSSHHRQERGESCSWLLQKQGDVVSHCFSLLYLEKVAAEQGNFTPPIFWLLLMKAWSINECVSHCPSATWLWEAQEAQGFLEVLAVWGEWAHGYIQGWSRQLCAASGVGCQGSGLAISYSLHNKHRMKKPHGHGWAANKCTY